MDELLEKELIKQDGRIMSIHRVVQEAVNVSISPLFEKVFPVHRRGIKLTLNSITTSRSYTTALIPPRVSFMNNSQSKKQTILSTMNGMSVLDTSTTA